MIELFMLDAVDKTHITLCSVSVEENKGTSFCFFLFIFPIFSEHVIFVCFFLGCSIIFLGLVFMQVNRPNIIQFRQLFGNCFLHPINFDSHPTKILKSHSTLFHTFAYGFQYPEVIFIHSGFRNPEGYFHILFKLPDGHIWK